MVRAVVVVLKLRSQSWLLRVIAVSAVFVISVALISVYGIPLKTVRLGNDHDRAHVADLVGRYNAYSSFIMSMADEPLLVVVKAFVPVWLALVLIPVTGCFWNDDDDDDDIAVNKRRRHVRWISVLARMAIAAAVTNAIASLNVQQMSTSVEASMTDTDAVVADVRAISVPISGNSSGNSIFRALITPLHQASADFPCTNQDGYDGPMTSNVVYEVRRQSFYHDVVPNAVLPEVACTYAFDADGVEIEHERCTTTQQRKRPFDNSMAKQLLALASRLYGSVNVSQAQQLLEEDDDALLPSFVKLAIKSATTANGSKFVNERANITFSRVGLSPHIAFDAVTVDVQHAPQYSAAAFCSECTGITWTGKGKDKAFTATIPRGQCGSNTCFLFSPIPASVSVYQLCNFPTALAGERDECAQNQTGRLIVYSKGRKVSGHEMFVERVANGSKTEKQVRVAGMQAATTFTVGILTWTVQDLAQVYDVPCDDIKHMCQGVAYNVPHTNTSTSKKSVTRVVTVARDGINAAVLPPLLSAQTRYLAFSNDRVIIQPSDFHNADRWSDFHGDECVDKADQYSAAVLGNHFYSDESLQTAYTGGMYFLFQNGHISDAATATTSTSRQSLAPVFAGSKYLVDLRASIPWSSALVSISSGVLLAVIVTGLACGAHRVRNSVAKNADAAKVVEVLLDNENFPKLLLRCELGEADNCHDLAAYVPSTLQLVNGGVVTLHAVDGVIHHDDDHLPMMRSSVVNLSDPLLHEATKHSTDWKTGIPLTVQLRRTRLVVAIIVLAAAYIFLLTQLVGDGFVVGTVPNDDKVSRLVQDYNFYCGTLGALAAAPTEFLLTTLVPVLALTAGSPSRWMTPLFALKLVMVWSLTVAINSVNIQPGSPRLQSRIGAAALATPQLQGNSYSAGNWSNNTILRTFLNEFQLLSDSKCTGNIAGLLNTSVIRDPPTFWPTSQPWQKLFLPEEKIAVEAQTYDGSFHFVGKTDLPVDPDTVFALVNTSVISMNVSELNSSVRPSIATLANYQLKLVRYQLTSEIEFLAVTETYDDDWSNVQETEVSPPPQEWTSMVCSASGCPVYDQELTVKALPWCENGDCANALIILARNTELGGDAMQLLPTDKGNGDRKGLNYTVHLVNPIRLVTATAGILRWKVTDLAKKYGAQCSSRNTTCRGLSYQLDGNQSQVLVVDERNLPTHDVSWNDDVNSDRKAPLVAHTSSLVRPRNFKTHEWDTKFFQGGNCSPLVEKIVENSELNHLYQGRATVEYVTYLSAMLYLFDTARVYDIIPVSSDSTHAMTLSFDANVRYAHISVTIPTQAAILSIVAASILLCLSLFVAVTAVLSENEDESMSTVTLMPVPETAEVIFDGTRYPKQFLTAHILLTDDILADGHENQFRALDSFHVEGATLCLREDTVKREDLDQMQWEVVGKQSRLTTRMTESCDELSSEFWDFETNRPAIA